MYYWLNFYVGHVITDSIQLHVNGTINNANDAYLLHTDKLLNKALQFAYIQRGSIEVHFHHIYIWQADYLSLGELSLDSPEFQFLQIQLVCQTMLDSFQNQNHPELNVQEH